MNRLADSENDNKSTESSDGKTPTDIQLVYSGNNDKCTESSDGKTPTDKSTSLLRQRQ
jgi:hypothetical protein